MRLQRGEKVRHISPDLIGASRGTVLATFLDAENHPVAAVQWADDDPSIDVVRIKWLDRSVAARNVHPIHLKEIA